MHASGFTHRTSRRRAAKSYRGTERHPAAAPSEPARLEDILLTDKLKSRRRRKPNSHYENIALHALVRVMATSPQELVDELLRLALELCNAGTSGLSLLEMSPQGEQVFRWTHLAGALRKHVGGSTPRNFSPCGVTLEHNAPQLFAQPARYFQYLGEVGVPIVEALVIPIYVGDQRPGTIWIVSHDDEIHFDSEDVRIMTVLAEFTSCVFQLTHALETERQARQAGDKEIAERKKTEEVLRQSQSGLESMVDARTAQLQQLSARLMALQDEERRRIARELHDSTGQVLAALRMTLDQMQKDLSTANLHRFEQCKELITLAANEIRNLSYLLHPPLIEEIGLGSAVAEYAQGFEKRSGLKVQVEVSEDVGRLDAAREIALFRIIQESLGNIHRHSGSATASVKIFCLDEDIVLEIGDQGRGLPNGSGDTMTFGVGIRSMQERVREFGGTLQIQSNGSGTNVRAVLPRQSSVGLAFEQTA